MKRLLTNLMCLIFISFINCSDHENHTTQEIITDKQSTTSEDDTTNNDTDVVKNDTSTTDNTNSETDTEEENTSTTTNMLLQADGTTETYTLLTQNLAPGYHPVETPDCAHPEFGKHINQIWDSTLEKYVFEFHIHTDNDNDRCINFDRQRNEIKTYDQSPNELLGHENETVTYTWKMKLPNDFKSSQKFTHLHQLKSVGGNYDSMPLYTLTTRKGTPDKLELRYAELDSQTTLKKTDLLPLLGIWVSITETITYGDSGDYSLTIKQQSNQEVLFEYTAQNKIHWRPDGEFVRPKWGIYRSLVNKEDLQDEVIRYTDFSITTYLN